MLQTKNCSGFNPDPPKKNVRPYSRQHSGVFGCTYKFWKNPWNSQSSIDLYSLRCRSSVASADTRTGRCSCSRRPGPAGRRARTPGRPAIRPCRRSGICRRCAARFCRRPAATTARRASTARSRRPAGAAASPDAAAAWPPTSDRAWAASGRRRAQKRRSRVTRLRVYITRRTKEN